MSDKPTNFNSLTSIISYFKEEQTAIDYLASLRFKNGAFCPHCGDTKVYKFSDNRRYKCAGCRKQFTVRVGTIFESSKIPLSKWFIAIYLITSHKKGISSHQLAKDIEVTQTSAWFMLHRIRYTLVNGSFEMPLSGIVEVDETYIGGANKNKSVYKRKELHKNGAQTGANHKMPVLGMLERNGKLRGVVLEKSHGKTIKPILYNNIAEDTTVITDGFGAYKDINKVFSGHEIIMHNNDEYVRGMYHTNSIEGVWSLLKRSILGIYHYTSAKHLQQYVDETVFRYNTRELSEQERINVMLSSVDNRLTYKRLTGKE